MESKRVLYISYDGLTDPLGQSQILPYLIGLSQLGYQISVVSNEKKDNYEINKKIVLQKLKLANIQWTYIDYTNKIPVFSTVLSIRKMRAKAKQLAHNKKFDIIHCRTILSVLIGDSVRKAKGGKLIFDIRGFWADERVEGNLWNLEKPLFAAVYKYFKKKEKEFFKSADAVITLTENAKNYISEHFETKNNIHVIPCAVDLAHFDKNNLNKEQLIKLRKSLAINENDFVLSYVGSLGTRYRLKEMMLFFQQLLALKPHAKFLFITKSETDEIEHWQKKLSIPNENIILTSSTYQEIPNLIALSHASIFFIVTSFSGKAVSPTKQAEIMSLGLPIVCNSELGDSDKILEETNTGIIPESYDVKDLKIAAQKLIDFDRDAADIRQVAQTYFSLPSAVEKYNKVYQSLD